MWHHLVNQCLYGRKTAKSNCKFPSVRTENGELLHQPPETVTIRLECTKNQPVCILKFCLEYHMKPA